MQIKHANDKAKKNEVSLPTTHANRKSNVSIVRACDGGVVGDESQEC